MDTMTSTRSAVEVVKAQLSPTPAVPASRRAVSRTSSRISRPMTRRGARRVIGLDIREDVLETARREAGTAGVGDSCAFTTSTAERVEVIVSIDGFEHYADHAQGLRTTPVHVL